MKTRGKAGSAAEIDQTISSLEKLQAVQRFYLSQSYLDKLKQIAFISYLFNKGV